MKDGINASNDIKNRKVYSYDTKVAIKNNNNDNIKDNNNNNNIQQ